MNKLYRHRRAQAAGVSILFLISLTLFSAAQSDNPADSEPQKEEESGGTLERILDSAEKAIEKSREFIRDKDKPQEQDAAAAEEETAEPETEPSESSQKDSTDTAEINRTPAIEYPQVEGSPVVMFVTLENMVAPRMFFIAHSAVEEAKEKGADLIVFEINTEGGRVDSATQIRDAIMDAPMTTAAFVKRAISAGALITLACDNIFMDEGSIIGAATPLMLTPGGPTTGEEDIKEKMLSYLMKEFESTAKANGHRGDIARAFVDRREKIPGLIEAGKLLTLDNQEAVDEGLAIATVGLPNSVISELQLENPEVVRYEISARDEFALMIASYAFICLGLGLLGIFTEIKSPGFGFPGIAGLFCIGLFFWANFLVMNATWVEIGLFIIGLVLIILEIAVIPGFGVAGIGGMICVGASIFLSMFKLPEGDMPFTWTMVEAPLINLLLTLIIAIILIAVALRYFHETPLWKRFALQDSMGSSDGYVSSESRESHIGSVGEATSVLRPGGVVSIQGKRFDAVTQGEYIEKGQKVRVVGIDGAQLQVEPIKEQKSQT